MCSFCMLSFRLSLLHSHPHLHPSFTSYHSCWWMGTIKFLPSNHVPELAFHRSPFSADLHCHFCIVPSHDHKLLVYINIINHTFVVAQKGSIRTHQVVQVAWDHLHLARHPHLQTHLHHHQQRLPSRCLQGAKMCHWHPLMTNGEYLQGTPAWILPQHQHARHWYWYYSPRKM